MAEDLTKLNEKFGLSRDAVAAGETVEFDAVERPKKERRPMYLKETVDMILDLTFEDLRNAYRQIDELTDQVAEVTGDKEKTTNALHEAQSKADVSDEDEKHLAEVQASLSRTTQMVEKFKAQNKKDAKNLRQQQTRVNELQKQLDDMRGQVSTAVSPEQFQSAQDTINELQANLQNKQAEYEQIRDEVNEVLDGLSEKFKDLLPNE